MRVGFVGAGRMGTPMVERLLGAGHQVIALGRSDEARARLAGLGATPVTEVRAVAEAEVVVVCAFDDDQVRSICLDDGLLTALAEGALLVIHTTGSPALVEELSLAGSARGVEVVDAPVSGGPTDIEAGQITLFVGGSPAAYERARAVLSAYASPVLHVGPTGSGQLVKLVNNALFAATAAMVAEAVGLGVRLGLEETALLAALPHGSSASRALSIAQAMGSVDAMAGSLSDFLVKDAGTVSALAGQLGVSLGGLEGPLSSAATVGFGELGLGAGSFREGV